MHIDPLLLSRILFSFTIMFHILFPVLTIGLSIFVFLMELLWVKTGKARYYYQARFWEKLFVLNFGIGVVTGIVMEFQFGTNWAAFSHFTGGFFGNVLGYEAALAFAAESAFLSLMVFGWNKISSKVHLISTGIVAGAATFSAFWIMDANSWMQAPAGVKLVNGSLQVHNYWAAVFNPFLAVSFLHKWVACLQISLLVVGGISAWYVVKNRYSHFFILSFKWALIASVIVSPIQIVLGDWSARIVTRLQPEKSAAMESHWETNTPGMGAPWAIVAWPDKRKERNRFEIRIPEMLSLLATHSRTGVVIGLKDIPVQNRPPIFLPFYSFRIMAFLGTFFLLLMIITVWQWWKSGLLENGVPKKIWLFKLWVWSTPLGYVSMEFGWIVREVGRQPWSIYKLLRTADGISKLGGGEVLWSLLCYMIIYIVLFVAFILIVKKIIDKGPDLKLTLPGEEQEKSFENLEY